MEKTKRIELFESAPIPKAVLNLAVPTIISSLVMVIYNLADTYFVGILNSEIQSSAVTFAAPVLLAFNAVNNLFGVGASSMMSRALGSKDIDAVHRSSAFGFYCALICGILFSLMCTVFNEPLLSVLGVTKQTKEATSAYLKWTVNCGAVPSILNVVLAYLVRSEGSSLHASIGTMSGCLLNIVLDPIFILPQGLNMGAAGAGLATFISNCVACLYFLSFILVKGKNTFVCINPLKFGFKKAIVLGIFIVGIPAAIQNLLNVTGMTVLNNLTADFGDDAVAAMGISQKIQMIPMYISLGLSQGIMPLISYNFASGNIDRMKKCFTFTAKISVGLMIIVSAVYFIFAGNFVTMFMKKREIVDYGTHFLRGLGLGLPFLCMDFLAVGVFQACGLGKNALIFALLRKVVLEIPALYILNIFFPLYGFAYAQLVAEFVLATAAIAVLIRLFANLKIRQSTDLRESAAEPIEGK